MKKTTVGILAGLAVLAGGLWVAQPAIAPDNCVHVYINYGKLDNNVKVNKCINANAKMNALDVFNYAGIDIEGTKKYGDAIVCRVSGLPAPAKETCADMPPEKAYWAVFIKPHKSVNIPLDFSTGWKWAETGINEVELMPGDSISLTFVVDEKVEFPSE